MSFVVPGPLDDQSVYFLFQIFGNVIYWVSGTGPADLGKDTTIIHYAISAFNTGLMSVLFAVYSVVLFVGTLNTAHQGEFLGRNWSSLWAPLRGVFGPIAVVPIKYGFCFIQLVLLYGVLVGVHLANHVWNKLGVSLDNTAIPAVPISLLNDVKVDVSKGVLYGSIQKVADDLGLQTDSLPTNSIEDSSDGSSYQCDSTKPSNQFYNIDGVPTFCLDAESTLPSIDVPNLVSSVNGLCQGSDALSTFNDFAYAMNLFYESPYDSGGITIAHPAYPNLTSSLLSQQCVNSMTMLLGNQSSTSYNYYYTFPVNGYSQQIVFKSSLGDTFSDSSDGSSDNTIYVEANGNIAFNFSNTDYTSGSENSYSKKASKYTNYIIDNLYNDNIDDANKNLNAYLDKLNDHLLNSVADSQSNAAQGIAENTDSSTSSDGESYYDKCKNYLISSDDGSTGTLSLRYLECLELEESGQTYGLSDNSDPDHPFKSYINSWWIGGESYLAVDKIMNYNLELIKDKLDSKLSYPNMNIASTVHYNVPMTMQFYPLVNGSTPTYTDSSGNTQDASDDVDSNAGEKISQSAGIVSQTSTIPDGMNLFSNNWKTMVSQAIYGSYNACFNVAGSSSDVCDASNALYANLMALPDDLQLPFVYLFQLMSSSGQSLAGNSSEIDFLNNLFNFLIANGVYQTTSTTSVPVYAVIDKIFGNLAGNGVAGIGLSSDVTSIMNEFYQLGMPSGDLFSKIMQAQQTGADVVQMVLDSFTSILDTYQAKFQSIEDGAKNIINDYSIGAGIASGIGAVFGSSAISSVGEVTAILGQTSVQLYMASQMGQLSVSLAWLPLAMMILGSLFTAAITFIVMMPLIPYFLFWAGTIVWVLSILEGLVATPLVALALVYPEGHEILGHGTAGIKIALNIIFRPVLMVIGVISAMALTYVLITYSAQGFHLVASLLLSNFSASSIVQGIVSCFLIFIYSSFMMIAFNKCFSVIYLIPDKVFDWIGASSNHRAGADDVQQLQSKAENAAGQAGSAMSSGAEKNIQGEKEKTQADVNADSQNIQVAQKAGGAAGSFVREEGGGMMGE
ncbi:conjugal transfer/type IV secretion protein DotA [Piscirickettsia salmonis]|uniref:DotA/TraY family protein n=1 Tax=Piscirickettsia salmonis TaxID=1238 RepID=UPI0012B898AA|nr:DotA/TraY family protein [Piscirickettsia salmonis]QGP49275.1 conjugal transfer/type IV secretion protein DotA [Piscirickettsia salmonis]